MKTTKTEDEKELERIIANLVRACLACGMPLHIVMDKFGVSKNFINKKVKWRVHSRNY